METTEGYYIIKLTKVLLILPKERERIMDVMSIGKNIATLRKEKGVKQEALATFVGVTPQAVSKWENGGVPDTELLPKIADFFGVSIDSLFGRSVTDYTDIEMAMMKKIMDVPMKERFEIIFEYCWAMENAMFCDHFKIEENWREYLEKALATDERTYSQMLDDNGFTEMELTGGLKYFLVVPEIEDTDKALFEGIDYTAFFKDFSDPDVFNACVLLNRRDHNKAFTAGLFVKHLGLEYDRADEIIELFRKYKMIYSTQLEMDDVVQTVYTFSPNPAFVSLLIFARELIMRPGTFVCNCSKRQKPYFK